MRGLFLIYQAYLCQETSVDDSFSYRSDLHALSFTVQKSSTHRPSASNGMQKSIGPPVCIPIITISRQNGGLLSIAHGPLQAIITYTVALVYVHQ